MQLQKAQVQEHCLRVCYRSNSLISPINYVLETPHPKHWLGLGSQIHAPNAPLQVLQMSWKLLILKLSLSFDPNKLLPMSSALVLWEKVVYASLYSSFEVVSCAIIYCKRTIFDVVLSFLQVFQCLYDSFGLQVVVLYSFLFVDNF